MKLLPIAFQDELWRAVRRQQMPKTVTRRPLPTLPRFQPWSINRATAADGWPKSWSWKQGREVSLPCLYGVSGQLLWGREALRPDKHGFTTYSEDGEPVLVKGKRYRWPWKARFIASSYAPRWSAREVLKNLGPTGEQLQAITEEEARLEGVGPVDTTKGRWMGTCYPYRAGFIDVWESLYTVEKTPELVWMKNPGVWRVPFERLPAKEARRILAE